ncbi:MAG TPA: dipeptidase [Vicinamibacterales bacterium]|nr:dipeptidase [Vicinamibacterales bacterium]
MKRYRLAGALWPAAGLIAMLGVHALAQGDLDARARDIHRRLLAVDTHVDVLLPSTPPQYFLPGRSSRADVDRLTRGGIGAVAFAIAVGPGPRTAEGVAEARKEADAKLASIRQFVRENGARVELALSAEDIVRIHKAGKIAVIESFLNARSIGTDLSAIDAFYRDGVRLFGFNHAGNNDFADSSRPSGEPAEEHHGLSPLGKQAVEKLNRLGVIIDVSQLTSAGVLQVLSLTKAPVIASHSDVRALVDNTRNLSDRELDAMKANGGVIDVTPFNAYLKPLPKDFSGRLNTVRQTFGLPPTAKAGNAGIEDGDAALPSEKQTAYLAQARALVSRATVSDYVDHIDYIAKRIGVDHVGIGTDFNHGAGIDGFDDESDAPNVTRELLRRGYTEEQIGRIWGGNFLRVFHQVEAASHH